MVPACSGSFLVRIGKRTAHIFKFMNKKIRDIAHEDMLSILL